MRAYTELSQCHGSSVAFLPVQTPYQHDSLAARRWEKAHEPTKQGVWFLPQQFEVSLGYMRSFSWSRDQVPACLKGEKQAFCVS